jgi:hypothetical protein
MKSSQKWTTMKNKSVFGLLMNPFTRIAGWQAFGLGLLFIGLMGFIGSFSGIAFDGVFDMHMFENTVLQAFSYLAIDIVSLVLVMWVVGLIVSKNFRFIDILGTMTLAKAPFLLLAILGYFTTAPVMSEIMKDPYVILQDTSFMIMMVLSLPVMIWSIVLMFNALKISCDLKGSTLTVAFIIGLFVSEIIAKVLIHYFV